MDPKDPASQGLDGQEFAALMVPLEESRGLMTWDAVFEMLMVGGEMCACTYFTMDSGSSCFFFLFLLDRAVDAVFLLRHLKV